MATLLDIFPAELPPSCARLLHHAPECFEDSRLGTIAAAMHSLTAEGRPVAPLTVRECLEATGKLGGAGDGLFLVALAGDAARVQMEVS